MKGLITLLMMLFTIQSLSGQQFRGKVISSETATGIAYVNAGVIGKNAGTVTDEKGNFKIDLSEVSDEDSLRFFMIGYEPEAVQVGWFKRELSAVIALKPVVYPLDEVKITYRTPRKIVLGDDVESNDFRSGFAYNNLGSELGHEIYTKRPVKLTDINLNIGVCTYDSVTYRLNIYQQDRSGVYRNILTSPIYLSFTREKTNNVITFDLNKYSIVIEGNVIVALELYKDLGEGRLLFRTRFFTGTTCHRKASEAGWTNASGSVGIYLNGIIVR